MCRLPTYFFLKTNAFSSEQRTDVTCLADDHNKAITKNYYNSYTSFDSRLPRMNQTKLAKYFNGFQLSILILRLSYNSFNNIFHFPEVFLK